MRILVLSQWYDPEPGFRVHPLSKELVARGHQVAVITGFPNYPQGRVYPGYRQRPWQWEQRDGVRVLRVVLYPSHDRSVVRRSLNYLSFAASASLLGPLLCGPADLMWVYHPPLTVGIPAWWIGLLRRVPFVYNIHDMWPEGLSATGMVRNQTVHRGVGWLADWLYRRAAALTVVTPGFKANLVAKGVPADKIHVIPNWADEDIYRPVPKNSTLAQTVGMQDRFNVAYAGNIGLAQGLDTVLDAAQMLQDIPKIQFVFIGDGVDRERLRSRARRMGLVNVRFIDQQPADRMADFFALADVLYVQLKDELLFQMWIPGKLYSYMACARPVLAAVVGDTVVAVREAGAGLVCPPQDAVALAQAVRELYEMPPARREAMGQAGRHAFLTHYARRVLVDRHETLLKDIANRSQQKRRQVRS